MKIPSRPSIVRILGWATLLVFSVGGAAIMVLFQGRDPMEAIMGPARLPLQIVLGAGAGLVTGFTAWWIVQRRFMRPVLYRYADLVGPLMAFRSDRIFVSICAGIGEELFFRGALQHWAGIPITAVLFVALHGYLDPRSWRISLYGGFMTIAMIGFGSLAARYGLLAPMIAHAIVDVVLLEKLQKVWLRKERESDGDR